jgi:pilus assembly protein Flp/PilA
VKDFAADSGGATAIEYALLGGLIALVIIASLTSIGGNVNGMIVSAASGLH